MWIRPTVQNLKQEYHVEVKLKGMNLGPSIKSEDDFISKARMSKLVTITPALDRQIQYRSRTKSKDQLLNLIRGYRSYPEFRNEKTVQQLYDRIGNGDPMTAPIVLKYKTGKMRVLAGNTRMDVAFQLGVNPKVLMLEIDK